MDDENDDSVVQPLLSDAPGFSQPQGKILERLSLERQDGGDDDLNRALALDGLEPALQVGFLLRGKDRSAIDDPAGESGNLPLR